MKSLVIAIASLIATVSANAQNSTVYYAPVTTNMEVGLGFDRATNQCILSIIEEASKAVDFNFDIINTNGESVLTSELSEGNVNVMPKDRNADNTVVINGTQVSSKALASAIASVQKELRPAAKAPEFPQRHRIHATPWGAPRFGQFARR